MKLDVNDELFAEEATAEDIVHALEQQKAESSHFILSENEQTYLQGCFNRSQGFHLEYQVEDAARHYTSSRNFSFAEVQKIACAYLNGDCSWREAYGWSKVEL